MTTFEMFKKDFKEHESLIRYDNKGVIIQKLLTPYKIKQLSKKIEGKSKIFI
jgi:hypothetical protein